MLCHGAVGARCELYAEELFKKIYRRSYDKDSISYTLFFSVFA